MLVVAVVVVVGTVVVVVLTGLLAVVVVVLVVEGVVVVGAVVGTGVVVVPAGAGAPAAGTFGYVGVAQQALESAYGPVCRRLVERDRDQSAHLVGRGVLDLRHDRV